ncbi:MAG: DUF1614 domain-containing protein [Deferribacteres bacterium]|nr:DUF1614 domain-containing protein [Deferribacteres bacterium]
MYFLPISLAIFLIFLLITPFLLFMLPAVAFAKLGLSPVAGLVFFFFCLAGSLINIPVYRKELDYYEEPDDVTKIFSRFFGIRVPEVHERIIALNLGGAVLPGLLCLYLLPMVNLLSAFLATAVTAAFSYYLSKPVRGVGIVIPAFIPPIVAAVAALTFAGKADAPAVAYISGVLGTLIGADLLRLHQLKTFRLSFLSIGGAGVFDGIFIVGIISVLLA